MFDVTAAKALEGKKVKLIQNLSEPNEKGESSVELEGLLMKVGDQGVMFRPRSKQIGALFSAAEIESIEVVETTASAKPRDIKRKVLRLPSESDVRQHLVDRHGYKVADIAAMTGESALAMHNTLDHAGLDLSHTHSDAAAASPAASGE